MEAMWLRPQSGDVQAEARRLGGLDLGRGSPGGQGREAWRGLAVAPHPLAKEAGPPQAQHPGLGQAPSYLGRDKRSLATS